jgi:2,3-dimethylmalate lyase
MRTVREMERAGVSAIQIEDQDWPKRCGHEPGRRIVSIKEMVGRIRAAVDTRQDEQTVIVARTDARSSEGIQAAIERANLYAEAGADVSHSSNRQKVSTKCVYSISAIQTPTLANQVEGGRTPMLPSQRARRPGLRISDLSKLHHSSLRIDRQVPYILSCSRQDQHNPCLNQMLDHRGLWNLFEYPAFIELENNYTTKES